MGWLFFATCLSFIGIINFCEFCVDPSIAGHSHSLFEKEGKKTENSHKTLHKRKERTLMIRVGLNDWR